MMRIRFLSLTCVALLGGSAAQGGLWQDLYHGMHIAATPSGGPLIATSDGTRVNGQRSGRLRIQPNQPGNGYIVEFNRTFGPDSQGRPEVLDLGAVELELAGTTAGTFGYTSKGFLIGNANVTLNNLNYAVRGQTGAQDAEMIGTLNLVQNLEVNQFGFYNLQLSGSNVNSQLKLDGVLVDDTVPLDFDIGPIAVKGNIFYDGFLAILNTLGVDTSSLQQLTPESPFDQIVQALRDQALVAGIQLTNEPVVGMIDTGMGTVVRDQTLTDLGQAAVQHDGGTVPEPSTLLLIGLGGFLCYGTRRR